MRNPHGFPIWYELLTSDRAASTAFYETVVGWTVKAPPPGDPVGYAHLESAEGPVGGMMQLTDQMCKGGAKATWLFYIGVDDVDRTVTKIEEQGGKVLMPAFDMEKVGRLAMVTDPQGIPFYVMRGSHDAPSTAFERTGLHKCNWNELLTPDAASANAFYSEVFGWKTNEKMAMGPIGDYVFLDVGDVRIGATMPTPPGDPEGWKFYFRVPKIDEAAERVKKAGGRVITEPMDVPGGDKVLVATDVHGVVFGLAAPGAAAT